jgi:hypothetical protein
MPPQFNVLAPGFLAGLGPLAVAVLINLQNPPGSPVDDDDVADL